MQKLTEGILPEEDAGPKEAGIAHPQICAAKTESQKDPDLEQCDEKHKISQPPGTERTQKSVKKAQTAAQHQGLPHMLPAVHPRMRRQKLAGRGSS